MAPSRASSDSGKGGLGRSGSDAFQLTLDYLKQETLEPLKGLFHFLWTGILGSLAIAIGVLLGLIGVLRLLQDETGSALTGDWSWVPYFAVVMLGLIVIGLAVWRITAGPGEAKLPRVKAEQAAAAAVLADAAPATEFLPPVSQEGTH
ncbi:MAG TPA: hypothetical protein VHV57_04610 [Acidimicrobiales bacterium]|jgi:hypothetical protein|nr:hypothetical protein [Acidimicrobiales bacterium]